MKTTTLFLIFISTYILIGCNKKEYSTDLDSYKILKREPVQEDIKSFKIQFNKDSELTAIAEYKVAARVLGKEEYNFDKESTYSPIDLALGWNDMSNTEKLKNSKISISQGTRFYHWYVPTFNVLTREKIENNSANTHIIPASNEIKSYIKNKVKKDDLIYMEGYLVNVLDKKSKWHWNTSLTRNDTGNGACEVFYVKKIIHLIDENNPN